MTKIALINFFFGQFPWYFNLFLKSCKFNPDINFILFTDNKEPDYLPSNVQFIASNLEAFNKLARNKISLDVEVTRPYKFCDFKPCFGLIFEEYIQGYDFWGFCDIDLLLGNIRGFITEEILNGNDVISVRHDYTSGFFMLFRNTSEIKNLFRKSKDYQKVLLSKDNYCFDECNYKYQYIQNPKDILQLNCEIESMLEVIVKHDIDGKLRAYFDFLVIEGTPGGLHWNRGKLIYKNRYEVLLYHFVSFKYNLFSIKEAKGFDEIPDQFFVDKYQIRYNKSISSFLRKFYTDYIIPNGYNLFFFSSGLLSRFFKKRVNCLKEGTYFLGETVFSIRNDLKGNNYLVKNRTYSLYTFIFSKKYFIIEEHPFVYRIKKDRTGDNLATHLLEIRPDGNTSVYDWRIN